MKTGGSGEASEEMPFILRNRKEPATYGQRQEKSIPGKRAPCPKAQRSTELGVFKDLQGHCDWNQARGNERHDWRGRYGPKQASSPMPCIAAGFSSRYKGTSWR